MSLRAAWLCARFGCPASGTGGPGVTRAQDAPERWACAEHYSRYVRFNDHHGENDPKRRRRPRVAQAASYASPSESKKAAPP